MVERGRGGGARGLPEPGEASTGEVGGIVRRNEGAEDGDADRERDQQQPEVGQVGADAVEDMLGD